MQRTGAGWRRASSLLFVAALASCQPERPQGQAAQAPIKPTLPVATAPSQLPPYTNERQAATEAEPSTADTLGCPPQPLRFNAEVAEPVWRLMSSPALRRLLQVHRYVGTVGGQPATAELQWYTPDSIEGSFYLHLAGAAYRLQGMRQQSGPLVLKVDAGDYDAMGGRWYLRSRPGTAVLNARWRDGRRQHTVALRESYVGAVRYGVRTAFYTADSAGSILQDFLTLPFPGIVHPRLRPLLNPGPQARIRLMDEAREDECDATNRLSVRLNDFGLFSYQLEFESRQTDGHGGRKDDQTNFLFDLVSGQPLTVASQLRPDYEMPLQRLLAAQLPPDAKDNLCFANIVHDDPKLVELPNMDAVCLTATGLEATYWAAQVCGLQTLHIPYRELRPLVRPGTPLARMLAARGLW